MDMKKKYMKPSIVVEKSVLLALMEDVSVGRMGFGGGNGVIDDGSGKYTIDSKSMYYDGFGTFGTFDDEDDY